MSVKIITNTNFGGENIPNKGLSELAKEYQRAQKTEATSFEYVTGAGTETIILAGTGTDLTYSEDGILTGGTVEAVWFTNSEQLTDDGPRYEGFVRYEGLNASVEDLSDPDFWKNLVNAANQVSLKNNSDYSSRDVKQGLEVDTGAGDDYVLDEFAASDDELIEEEATSPASSPVKVNLGVGNDTITQMNNGLDYVIDGGEGEDTIVYEASKEDVSFARGEDGSIIVTTKDSGTDTLTNVENVRFGGSEESYSIADLLMESDDEETGGGEIVEGKVQDNPDETQYLVGKGDGDTFVVDGLSFQYGWGPTLDGTGIVIWHLEDKTHDILWDFEQIEFADATVPLKFWQLPSVHFDDPDATQYLEGTEGRHDSFFIEGNAEDYGWDKTEDEEGIVVWHHESGTHDILYDFDAIEFKDESVLVSDIM